MITKSLLEVKGEKDVFVLTKSDRCKALRVFGCSMLASIQDRGADVDSMVFSLPKDTNKGVVAAYVFGPVDTGKNPNHEGLAVLLGVTREADGKIVVCRDSPFVPAADRIGCVIEFNIDQYHTAYAIQVRIVDTFYASDPRVPNTIYVPDPDLLCQFLAGTVEASAVIAAARSMTDTAIEQILRNLFRQLESTDAKENPLDIVMAAIGKTNRFAARMLLTLVQEMVERQKQFAKDQDKIWDLENQVVKLTGQVEADDEQIQLGGISYGKRLKALQEWKQAVKLLLMALNTSIFHRRERATRIGEALATILTAATTEREGPGTGLKSLVEAAKFLDQLLQGCSHQG